ncbi:hypothetical protein CK203_115991 [Vitis vinifera]|uniref:Uncharacterized protein n=1 Tax=Vitis vinifera TaxID=29760 RepID=A0A438CU12_VITVI|nr:hypothetical protein CK203_115991 [Vitis vinifera]
MDRILRPGVTRFAITFIALKSLHDHKHDLQALVTRRKHSLEGQVHWGGSSCKRHSSDFNFNSLTDATCNGLSLSLSLNHSSPKAYQVLAIPENPTLKSPPRGSQGDFTSSSLMAETTKLCILALGTFPGNLSSKELEV